LKLDSGEVFRWISLAPNVVAVRDSNKVANVDVGETFVLGVVAGAPQGSRVVVSVAVVVLPKQLSIAGTWVDTIKVWDGKPNADVVAGVLLGVLPKDEGRVVAVASAIYDRLLMVSSDNPIYISYTLDGSRAHCYLPPQHDTTTCTIKDSGSYSDIWGVVMKREEVDGATRDVPFANVSVSYSVSGSLEAGAVQTDRYGRYFISGLGSGDTVELRPKRRGTYTLTPLQQTWTIPSDLTLTRADTFLYHSNTMVELLITDAEGNLLKRFGGEEISDTIYFALPCNRRLSSLEIIYITPVGVLSAPVVGEGVHEGESEVFGTSDTLHRLSVDLKLPGRKVITVELFTSDSAPYPLRYTIVLDKRYGLFEVVTEHLGDLMVVNNNPETNRCGCTFAPVTEWWRLQNGEWRIRSEKLHYSASLSAADRFSVEDSIYVVLYAVGGDTLRTCPDVVGGSGAGSNGSAMSSVNESVYPNPVPVGGMVYLREATPVDENLEARYETYRLFGSQGKLASSGKASALLSGLTMPDTPGTYYLILEGKAGRRAMQIAVGRRSR
jgi:hypothetical protein